MFTLNVRKLFRNHFDSWQSAAPRRKTRPTVKPRLEELEERYCPANTDLWVSTGNQNWTIGTNWSEGHAPNTTDNAVFDPTATDNGMKGTNTACSIPTGQNLPTIDELTMNNYTGTLSLQSNLAANAVTINPRTGITPGQSEIIINSGSNLYALLSLTWSGGNVGGAGNFEVGGTDTINGTSSADQPTLATRMDIGTDYLGTPYAGSLTFSATSQPLVVVQSANIYVNNESSLQFNNQVASGKTSATAISNGDTAAHSITVNTGGTLTRTNVCELFVATGLNVNGGTVQVSNPSGQNTGNPLHFTRPNSSNGPGLQVNSGSVQLGGDFTSDYGGGFGGGTVTVSPGAKLTLGVNANSSGSGQTGGAIILQGTLVSHGGFSMYGGTFGTNGSLTSVVQMDTGNTFYLIGGELDVTKTGDGAAAVGALDIEGNFVAEGGSIVEAVNSKTGDHSKLYISGNANLYPYTTFICTDLKAPPPNYSKNWLLMVVGGKRQGDFFYNLPTNMEPDWENDGGGLYIEENT